MIVAAFVIGQDRLLEEGYGLVGPSEGTDRRRLLPQQPGVTPARKEQAVREGFYIFIELPLEQPDEPRVDSRTIRVPDGTAPPVTVPLRAGSEVEDTRRDKRDNDYRSNTFAHMNSSSRSV